jgi:hypothetical protein
MGTKSGIFEAWCYVGFRGFYPPRGQRIREDKAQKVPGNPQFRDIKTKLLEMSR